MCTQEIEKKDKNLDQMETNLVPHMLECGLNLFQTLLQLATPLLELISPRRVHLFNLLIKTYQLHFDVVS